MESLKEQVGEFWNRQSCGTENAVTPKFPLDYSSNSKRIVTSTSLHLRHGSMGQARLFHGKPWKSLAWVLWHHMEIIGTNCAHLSRTARRIPPRPY
ncbi:MAG TPA: hypothetical protein VK850_09505 [Candidatus Binatia bacterium]|nr:hypothetical protein [Candidatus Binatia bacterium]